MKVNILGTEQIETSVSGENIIKKLKPKDWNYTPKFKTFAVMNYNDCKVKINDGEPIFLGEKQGFFFEHDVAYIESFEFVDSGIEYQVIGVV